MFGVYKLWLGRRYYLHFWFHFVQFLLMNVVALCYESYTFCFSRSLTILLEEQRFHIIKLFNINYTNHCAPFRKIEQIFYIGSSPSIATTKENLESLKIPPEDFTLLTRHFCLSGPSPALLRASSCGNLLKETPISQ